MICFTIAAIKEDGTLWTWGNNTFGSCGYDSKNQDFIEEPVKIVSGGPMMGFAISGAQYACTKTSGCLLLMSEAEAFRGSPSPCINCGKCAKNCPMRLMPMYIESFALSGDYESAEKYGATNCLECGSCAYNCPAKRSLVQSIQMAKAKIKEKKNGR